MFLRKYCFNLKSALLAALLEAQPHETKRRTALRRPVCEAPLYMWPLLPRLNLEFPSRAFQPAEKKPGQFYIGSALSRTFQYFAILRIGPYNLPCDYKGPTNA